MTKDRVKSLPTLFWTEFFVPLYFNIQLHLTDSKDIATIHALAKSGLQDSGSADDFKSNFYLFFQSSEDESNSDRVNTIQEKYNEIGVELHINNYECLKNGTMQLNVCAMQKVSFLAIVKDDPFFVIRAKTVAEYGLNTKKAKSLIRQIKNLIEVIDKHKIGGIRNDLQEQFDSGTDDGYIAFIDGILFLSYASGDTIFPNEKFIESFLELDISVRLEMVYALFQAVIVRYEVQNGIAKKQRKANKDLQRRYELLQQKKVVEKALNELTGEEGDEAGNTDVYNQKIEDAKMPEHAHKVALEGLARLSHMSSSSQEARVLRDYLDALCALPWSQATEDNLDTKRAKEILDAGHFGLDKIKKRLVEEIAIRKLNPNRRGAILCFYGPPGVGKTSLGTAIASALGRKFHRISLGGVRDESEIRGHRRTYIGALPGKFIQALIKLGVKNPLIMLDEVDKLGNEAGKANVASALLEVLDPEQNNEFIDHYLEIPFDLSQIMFICTVNELHTIPQTLRDRLEIIELSGYTEKEKLEIVKRHLLPKQLADNGVDGYGVEIGDDVISHVINGYTAEAGVRNVERRIADIIRTVVVDIVKSKVPKVKIVKSDIPRILGPVVYDEETTYDASASGVVNGLSVSYAGGHVLLVESSKMKGTGNLIITGNLRDVIKESTAVAFTAAKKYLHDNGFNISVLSKLDFHINFDDLGTPKDGPFAGVALALSIISTIREIPVRNDIAITGEISLRGRVMPVGGIKQKVLGAHRVGCKTVFLPMANKKDEQDIPEAVRNALDIRFVSNLSEVVDFCINKGP